MDEWLWKLFKMHHTKVHSFPKNSPGVILMMKIIRKQQTRIERRLHSRYSSKDLMHTKSMQSLETGLLVTITNIFKMMPRRDKHFLQHPTGSKETEW